MVSGESGAGVATRAADRDLTAAARAIDDLIVQTAAVCRRRLTEREFAVVGADALRAGIDPGRAIELISRVAEPPESRARIAELKAEIRSRDLPASATFERWLLLQAALASTERLATLPVPHSVIAFLCDEFQYFATATDDAAHRFEVSRGTFVDMAKKATLRRFPAGQFDWEVSGIPRRYVLRVRPAELPRVAWFVAARMRGLAPVFFSHLNPRRPNTALNEHEALRSYYRMAEAIRLQPEVIGFGACSWFRSPDTHAVSPHLAWVSRVFLENGGFVAVAGRADPDCGVLHRSSTRRRLYETGQFIPTEGLVMWPRRAMLAWADAHPELRD